jgi:hypothetical protein
VSPRRPRTGPEAALVFGVQATQAAAAQGDEVVERVVPASVRPLRLSQSSVRSVVHGEAAASEHLLFAGVRVCA